MPSSPQHLVASLFTLSAVSLRLHVLAMAAMTDATGNCCFMTDSPLLHWLSQKMIGAEPAEQATYAAATYADDDDDAAGDDDNDTFESETSTLTEVILLYYTVGLTNRSCASSCGCHWCADAWVQVPFQTLLCCVTQQEQELLTGDLEPIAQSELDNPQTTSLGISDDDDEATPEAGGPLPS